VCRQVLVPTRLLGLPCRCLPDAVVLQCIQLATQHAMTLTAYCNDRIFCAAIDDHTNR